MSIRVEVGSVEVCDLMRILVWFEGEDVAADGIGEGEGSVGCVIMKSSEES